MHTFKKNAYFKPISVLAIITTMTTSSMQGYARFAVTCKQISESEIFKKIVLFTIIFSSILVGAETYDEIGTRFHLFFEITDFITLVIFGAEIFFKIVAEGKKPINYFKDGWNTFDFLIVVFCFLPFNTNFMAVIRLVRILRVLRLIKALPKLQLLVDALIKSVPSMGYVITLMMILFYIYAALGTYLFKNNDPVHFGNLQRSTLTLFTSVTLENWSTRMYTQMYGSDVFGYDEDAHNLLKQGNLTRKPEAQPLAGAAYFMSFILFGAMVTINLFIGVIMNGIEEVKMESKKATTEVLQKEHEEIIAEELGNISRKIDDLRMQINSLEGKLKEKSGVEL